MSHGFDTEFSRARQLLTSVLYHWPHPPHERCASVLLCGPPGNGKSHLLQNVTAPSVDSVFRDRRKNKNGKDKYVQQQKSAAPLSSTSPSGAGNDTEVVDAKQVLVVPVFPCLAAAVSVFLKDGSTGLRRLLRRELQKRCMEVLATLSKTQRAQTQLSALVVFDHLECFLKADGEALPSTSSTSATGGSNAAGRGGDSARDADAVGGDKRGGGGAGGSGSGGSTPHAALLADLHTVLRTAPSLVTKEEADSLSLRTCVFVSLFSSPLLDDLHAFARAYTFDVAVELTTPTEAERRNFFMFYTDTAEDVDASSMSDGSLTPALADALALRTGGITYGGLVEVLGHARAVLTAAPPLRTHIVKHVGEGKHGAHQVGEEEEEEEAQVLLAATLAQQAVQDFHSSGSIAALEYRRSAGYVDVQATRWVDIAGMTEVKQTLMALTTRAVAHRQLYVRFGVRPSTGVLLYGPPGTGKTMLARAMATELNASFVYLDLPELVQAEVGESERRLNNFFAVARERSPSVMFMDELQAAFGVRYAEEDSSSSGAGGSAHDSRLVSHLLHLLDVAQADTEHTILFVGATNVVQLLDPLLLRAGRLDTLIEVPLPDTAARESLVKRQVYGRWASWFLTDSDDNNTKCLVIQQALVDAFVQRSEGFSGAELQNAASTFALRMVRYAAEQTTDLVQEGPPSAEAVRDALFATLVGQERTEVLQLSDVACEAIGMAFKKPTTYVAG